MLSEILFNLKQVEFRSLSLYNKTFILEILHIVESRSPSICGIKAFSCEFVI